MSRALERSVHVACPVAHAFAVFTARIDLWWPAGHRRFPASELTLEAMVGGRFFERSASGEVAELGEVVACDPPHVIAYTWRPGSITQPTLVEVRFCKEDKGTRVDVHHREGDAALGEAWPQRAALFERGWGIVMPAFAAFAEQPESAAPDSKNESTNNRRMT